MKVFEKYIKKGTTMFTLKSPIFNYKYATLIILAVNIILGIIVHLEGYTIFDYPLNGMNLSAIITIYLAIYLVRKLLPKFLDLFGFGDENDENYQRLLNIIRKKEIVKELQEDISSRLFNYKDLKYGLLITILAYIPFFISWAPNYKFYNCVIHPPLLYIAFTIDQSFFFFVILLHAFTALYVVIIMMMTINKSVRKENLKIWHFNNLLKNEILFASRSENKDIKKLHNMINNMEPFHKFRNDIQEITKIPLIMTYAILVLVIMIGFNILISKTIYKLPIYSSDIVIFSIVTIVILIFLFLTTRASWITMRNVKKSLLEIFELVYDELEQKYMILMAMGRSQKVEETKIKLRKDLEVLNSMLSEIKGYKTFPISTSKLMKIITSSLIPLLSMIIKMYIG